MQKPNKDNHTKGVELLNKINPEAYTRLADSLQEVAPELTDFILSYPYGQIYARPGLDLKTRELITLASLITQGHPQAQLKAHIQGALNVGCSREEIVEVILQMTVYAGFPAALNAMYTAKEVFTEAEA